MLPFSQAMLLLVGIVVILITPGPTNTLLAAAGLRQGVRRAMPLLAGEWCGYIVSISVWGYVIGHASQFLAWLPTAMRIACSVYIAFLAVRMWRAAVDLPHSQQKAVDLRTLFVTTLLNPKAMLFAGTIFPPAAFVRGTLFSQSMAIFTAALVPIGFLWITFGAALGTGKLAWASPARVQRCASVMLGAFSFLLVLTVFH